MNALYTIPDKITRNNTLEQKLKLLKDIKRSFFVYRVDTGSCNGCDIEIFSAIIPQFDPERLGFRLVASPRHADILICTGPLTRMMRYPLIRAYEAAPDPKIVIATGACGCSGGIFHDAYGIWSGIESHIPVDLFIPGCPPHPATILHGIGLALGLLEQKIKNTLYDSDAGTPPAIDKPLFGNILFERDINVEARLLMGYSHGHSLYNRYINLLARAKKADDIREVTSLVNGELETETDPRLGECIKALHHNVYVPWMVRLHKIDPGESQNYLI